MQTYTYSQKLMGTELIVSIDSEDQTKADLAFADILLLGQSFESEFSRFISNSPLSILNEQKKLEVSNRFISVLKKAQDLYAQTNGVFNPLVQVKNLGYKKDFSESDTFSNIVTDEYSTDVNNITITGNTISLQENQTIDFGGFLKGLFCDEAKKFIQKFTFASINMGGDMYIHGEKNITLTNPITKQKLDIQVKNSAITTSGDHKRTWKIDGQTFHHIVDPKTKTSSESDLCSVTIVSGECYIADAYATVSFILGSEKAVNFLDSKKLGYILIQKNGEILQNNVQLEL